MFIYKYMLFLKAKIIGLFYRATNHHIVNVKEQGLCHIQSTDDTPFNIKKLVDTFVEEFTPMAEAKGLTFVGRYNGEDITVLGNKKYISSLINNLLTNALHCTSDGYVILNLEYVKRELIICVADSGTGMSAAQIQRFNLSEMKFGNTELSEHIGRDLTDTLGIVNKLRGSIKVFSDAEKGCKFIIQLPVSIYE